MTMPIGLSLSTSLSGTVTEHIKFNRSPAVGVEEKLIDTVISESINSKIVKT